MKRLSLFLSAVAAALIMTGCGGKTEVIDVGSELSSSFRCDMDLLCENTEFTGKLTRIGAGKWEAEFDSPDTVSGVKLTFDGNNVTASYKGLAFTVPKSALPVRSLLLNLTAAVDEAGSGNSAECVSRDGKLILEGSTDQGKYTLCLDEKTCDLVSFSMDNLDMKMNFENTEEFESSDIIVSDDSEKETDETSVISQTEGAQQN